MKKLKGRTLLVCLAIVFIMSCGKNEISSDQPNPSNEPSVMVDAGDYNLFTETVGSGNHTLVFESALGDHFETWSQFTNLVENHQVITYNRAGYAPSETASNTRDLEQLAADLHQVILQKSENEKVILVGYIFGGATIRYYATQHPEKVKGLIFINPMHEGYISLTQAREDSLVSLFNNDGRPEVANEVAQFIEDYALLEALPNLPNVPTVVLTSVGALSGDDKDAWVDAHKSLGEGLTDFTHTTTEVSQLEIHEDEPQLVIDAIDSIIN